MCKLSCRPKQLAQTICIQLVVQCITSVTDSFCDNSISLFLFIELKEGFDSLGKNGRVSIDDIATLLRISGQHPKESEIEEIKKHAATDG